MGKLIALLSGSAGIWWLIVGLGGSALVGGGVGWEARAIWDAPALSRSQKETAEAKLATETCEKNRETARANGNALVTQELRQQIQALRSVIDDLERQKRDRDAANRKFLDELEKMGKTSVCGGSAPERLYRNSVQLGHPPAVP